ncbi:cation diffusion facilitator family transporter [Methylacidiphilum kamchatkense]|uniref:Cation diffusion facilitator family transporter n=1 Tax=Methylacidiphilum kamchatkense Kam1 TaxID=1202785 RepID=A0A516TPJ3_9BACT|nr:cation diffusion facilitator family transporter [Methylacidiphilum kamchatkense]QDQ43163.1 cation diffusion facilitator family transporter [Methylacidiphilum kamchatkense Kam1]
MNQQKQINLFVSLSILVNFLLAAGKISFGLSGHSFALIADGLESLADIGSSFLVWFGIKISQIPPDPDHPFGHGKADPIAAFIVSILLMLCTLFVSIEAIKNLWVPTPLPSLYTLPAIGMIVIIKEIFYRIFKKLGENTGSLVLCADSWHHRSDALSSLAAFLGILLAVVTELKQADSIAAIVSAIIIFWNSIHLIRPSFLEMMDTAPSKNIEQKIRNLAEEVPGVIKIEKCRIRKSGQGLLMDIHVMVPGSLTVREGHIIGHKVKDKLCASPMNITDVVVHIEPVE